MIPTLSAITLPAIALLACADPPPPPDVDLRPGRGRSVLRLLDRLPDARLELSPANLPPGADEAREHRLDSGWRLATWGEGRVWMHPSPVRLDQKRHSRQPPGLSLTAGQAELHFDTRLVAQPDLDQRWILWGDDIFLNARQDPATWPEPPVLRTTPAAQREAAFNLDASGQDPLDFARRDLTIGPLTHPCLYLPAPSEAAFDLRLPDQQPALRYAIGMASTGEEGATGRARLDVSIDDTVVASTEVRTGEGWRQARIDLDEWAGQAVTLRFRSDPLGGNNRDYLCVGSPELVAAPPADPDPVRVVVIGIDTLRTDHLGINGYDRPTSPNLDRLGQQALRFDNSWAPAPRTRPSFRTATTGRWPLRALAAPSLGRMLAERGFQTAGIVANVHLVPRMGFADGYDRWFYENGASAEDQVDRALDWLRVHDSEDSFLFLHLMDPHIFYLAPQPFTDRFTDQADRGDLPERFNRWMVEEWEAEGSLTAEEKRFIEGRYDGEIAYMDDQLGRLFEALDDLPGRTMVVVHTDHGEEFWDHGGFEHNHSLYDELTRALLWFRLPGVQTGRQLRTPASLADITPTVLEAVGIPQAQWPELDGRSLWPLLDPGESARAAARLSELDARPLHLGYLMFDTERWAVVARDEAGVLHKYTLQTDSGRESLFDLEADPGELQDLSADHALDPWRERLGEATGWPVGPGWRVRITDLKAPLRLRFDAEVRHSGVIDPEAAATRRANLEWGELPAVLPHDVATVTLEPDRRTVAITPGPQPTGTITVLGPHDPPVLVEETGERPLGPGRHPVEGGVVVLESGTIIVPLETEATALTELGEQGEGTDAQLEALRQLGYIED